MKKIIFAIPIFLLLSLHLFSGAIIINTSSPYYVGQNIGFDSNCHDTSNSFTSVVWDFGDGTTRNLGTQDRADFGWQYHTYRNPGTYTVRFSRNGPLTTPYCWPLVETRNITISENRYIQASPAQPAAGQQTQFTAVNFNTPNNIRWEMGDGTILSRANIRRAQGQSTVTHTYAAAGTYTVKAYDWDGDMKTTPVTLVVNVTRPVRAIAYTPAVPRVDEPVYFTALNFFSQSIDWNFGDGTVVAGGSTMQMHRYQSPGTFTVSANESAAGANLGPVTTSINVLPENRSISLSAPQVKVNEELTITAHNFRADFIWWDFGDGTQRSGFHEERHTYTRPGTFTITARDENGQSQKPFQATVAVIGISDEVFLEVAELRLDNGKHYKIVPKNSKDIRAVLRMKMRGTGIIAGNWIVDSHPYEFFSEVAIQGELKEIYTKKVPGLPVLQPGMHTVTLRLTRPSQVPVTFPILKYYVLPYENIVEILTPADGFVAKDKEIPEFSWKEARGGSKYQIAFSNYLYPLLENDPSILWIDTRTELKYTPDSSIWDRIKRNRWTYWKVRALDSSGNVVAESDIIDIKVVIGTAKVTIEKVTDLEGNVISAHQSTVNSKQEDILVQGSLEYEGNARYLVLRVYADDDLVDQLLFRDIGRGDTRHFETSVPNKKSTSRVVFQVLNTSSPSVILGIHTLILKK